MTENKQRRKNPDENHQGEFLYKLFYLYRGPRGETRARHIKTLEKKLSKENLVLAKKFEKLKIPPEEFRKGMDQIISERKQREKLTSRKPYKFMSVSVAKTTHKKLVSLAKKKFPVEVSVQTVIEFLLNQYTSNKRGDNE